MTITRGRREEGSGGGAWDPFRCGIALWLSLLGLIALAGLIGAGDSTVGIVVLDTVFAALVTVFAAAVLAGILPLFERLGTGWWQTLAWTAGCFVAIAAFMAGYMAVARAIGFHYAPASEEYASTGWPVWGALISCAAVPAVFEETAFRGVIQTGMEQVMAPRDALIVQAAMFSVLHLSPVVFVSHFAIGLALGVLRSRTRSIYPGMLVHGAWNATVFLTT